MKNLVFFQKHFTSLCFVDKQTYSDKTHDHHYQDDLHQSKYFSKKKKKNINI